MLVDNSAEIRGWFEQGVAATALKARAEAPVRTGALARSISSAYHGKGRWTVTASADYARFVHEGTKGPYRIKPRPPKRWLAWEQNGRIVVVREVMHPGIKNPNPFLVRALDEVWGTRR
jgi:Bacteriophage HK97-gp10, putative tail-component